MRCVVVVGDKTSGGGTVVSGSADTDINGKAVARVGDKVVCSSHGGTFSIVSGDESLIIDGQAVARNGDKVSCGCTLIAGRQHVVFVEAGASHPPAVWKALAAADPAASPAAPNEPVCEECLLAAAQDATVFLAR